MTSTATVLAAATIKAPSPTAPASATATVRDRVAHRVGELFRLPVEVVALDLLLGPRGDRLEEGPAVVAELTADLADEPFFVLRQSPAVDVVGDALPDPQVLLDHPVDQLVDDGVDLLLGVGHDLALELAPDLVLVEQVEDAPEADRLLEEFVAALQHAVDDVFDPRQVIAELAAHVVLIGDQLALDVVDRRDIVAQNRQPLVGDLEVLLASRSATPSGLRSLRRMRPS